MSRSWTFGQRLGLGFAVTVALIVAIGAIGAVTLRGVVDAKDRVITVDAQQLVEAEQLRAEFETKSSANRAFLLTGEPKFLDELQRARARIASIVTKTGQQSSGELRVMVDAIGRAEANHNEAVDAVIGLRRANTPLDTVLKEHEARVLPARAAIDTAIDAFVQRKTELLARARIAASETASTSITLMIAIAIVSLLFAIAVAFILARSLSRQIGGAVARVQSSSAELQAAANQQATGAKEQSTAMNEISTTISELLATSRQIAESARRVAQVADQTASTARAGDVTVSRAHDSIAGIRKQVDQIVTHMLDLGRKSQQIGSVLEIVSELAEQTNILAINATIEAAGAGDSGKRFAVVADEIRKLADRVAASTKEIRVLIEEVRAAVNTTVMATETGSKAVDSGSRQFTEVTSSLGQISGMVGTTTDAAREIELSTKQQTTAVEQVNVAIVNVAQATRETEASSSQTLATVSELATLSKQLMQLIQPER